MAPSPSDGPLVRLRTTSGRQHGDWRDGCLHYRGLRRSSQARWRCAGGGFLCGLVRLSGQRGRCVPVSTFGRSGERPGTPTARVRRIDAPEGPSCISRPPGAIAGGEAPARGLSMLLYLQSSLLTNERRQRAACRSDGPFLAARKAMAAKSRLACVPVGLPPAGAASRGGFLSCGGIALRRRGGCFLPCGPATDT